MIAPIWTYHAVRAPMIPTQIVRSVVPERFQPRPSGSEMSGTISCPWINK